MHAHRETEIRVRVSNISKTLEMLNSKTKEIDREFQVDLYFNAPHKDFLESDEILRLRKTSSKTMHLLTYKGPKSPQSVWSREELEVYVENGDILNSIFRKLGFNILEIVEKTRTTYELGDFLIHLDCVNNLGYFLEVEKRQKSKIEQWHMGKRIFNLLQQLHIAQEDLEEKTYIELMTAKKLAELNIAKDIVRNEYHEGSNEDS